jgi:excisionase family DNA binding protein
VLAPLGAPDPGQPRPRLDLAAGSFTSALATLPEVLTAREAAAILRVGRNQLYQAVERGELGAVRIGRSIRIPKQALLDLLAAASPPTASGNE